jgi:polyphosphate kinase
MVAPTNLRERFKALISREREHALQGKPARIIAKMNSLTDVELIQELYAASQAGVSIDLIVRGVCMLRPGVEGLSQNIRVRSIVGRFLEHSRIFYFKNGGKQRTYIGSADWMHRNLNRRVEVVAPVKSESISSYLKDVVLEAYLRDNTQARELQPDGSYRRLEPAEGEEPFSSQLFFQFEGQ